MVTFFSDPDNSRYLVMNQNVSRSAEARSMAAALSANTLIEKWFHMNGIAVFDGARNQWRVLSRIFYSDVAVYNDLVQSYV